MTNALIMSIILLSVVGINYGCIKLAHLNPDIISGFKMSDEPKQRERDKAWLELLFKYMHIANIVTLIGGFIGILCGFQIIYYLSLVLPISVAALLAYGRRNISAKKKKKKLIIIITILVTIVLVCLPVWYSCQGNLKVTFRNDKMTISGLYGVDIPINNIKEAKLCQSLPLINIKTNGFALAETCLGHFRTKEGKDIILFVHSNKYFVRITLNDGKIYYLSYRERAETEQLLNRIQKRIRIINKNGN